MCLQDSQRLAQRRPVAEDVGAEVRLGPGFSLGFWLMSVIASALVTAVLYPERLLT